MKTVSIQQDMESYASAFRQGHQEGIANLFDAWYPSLCDYICSLINDRFLAEELASEAFVKTWRYHERFHTAGEIRAYLFTIARRDAFRLVQQRQKDRALKISGRLSFADIQSPEIWQSEISAVITNAINTLPPRCRQIFELLYVEGKDTGEVANELLISPYTVRAQKARGIHLLRPKLRTILCSNE